MTDTTDLLTDGGAASAAQDASPAAPTRTRRRATSGGARPETASGDAGSDDAGSRGRASGNLAARVLPELQALAGELGISGVGRLRKSQLIEAIQAAQGRPNGSATIPSPEAAAPDAAPAPGAARTGRASRNGVSVATDREPPPTSPDDSPAAATAAATAEPESGDDEGARPERVDRGRERFLEREARRQERQAAQSGESPGAEAPSAGDTTDRSVRQDHGDRQQNDRQPRDRHDGGSPGAGSQGNGPREDDEFGSGRRGRFRERGRNRNRGARQERFGSNELDPVVSDDDVLLPVGGILDILDNYGFIRTTGYLTGPNDVYVSLQQVGKYSLRRGDAVTGAVRQQRDGERKDKYNALVRLDSVNGLDPAEAHNRPDFTKLTPLYPQDRLRLETESSILTTRVIDLVMPIGKGQRALIVSPPKAGKTMVMQAIANAITTNNPECHLMVVLVDERPEEVTDMQRSVKGEVIASTFDRPPQDHITVAELSIERAKRLVELGHDVVVLLDSITRLGRAYNLGAPASGRILTGGVDSAALYPPKRFLGAARNIEHGGSLTIFATALVETGSAMDTVIFEEFKGTGNAELKLDRRLADKRIFPAIDVDASGTRKEEILLAPEELRIVLQLRRVLHALDATASLELLLSKMKSTRTNVEFLMQIQKTTVDQD